ncbi:hypothetical protein Poli38472_000685 [Pythium oligandrum]|uniref:Carboxypeptidase n=1 Tax=Pythium oligandrum TaxID=41045 RepID=A0A8K1FJD4_PYTOL|nr:hypothetical protein Poli38472_000685 [Pythium oligandrum]|eukprot:TMW60643.1 hypothetical protein Poli38472_000685 [Pythium oligandrum]
MAFSFRRKRTWRNYVPIGDSRRFRLSRKQRKSLKYFVGVVTTVLVTHFVLKLDQYITQQFGFDPMLRSVINASMLNVTYPGESDLITELHGKPDDYTSRLYSGYLPISNGGQAFYFFAESLSAKPEDDPVLLWLNGGPGASSLAGCFTENGPLLVNEGGQSLRVNEYAWNNNANFLCIESPVGVGFSYNISGVYESDDLKQADELYGALQQFYVKFPWLRENDFIISGESYGGVYVPTTAKRIVEGNLAGEEPKINLKKFVVGNGVNEFGALSKIVYAYYHGIIGTEEYRSIRQECPEMKDFEPVDMDSLNPQCVNALGNFNDQIIATAINTYHTPAKCFGKPMDGMGELVKELQAPQSGFPHPISLPLGLCLDFSTVNTFFNIRAVRDSMHANKELKSWTNLVLTAANMDMGELAEAVGVSTEDAVSKVLRYNATLVSSVRPIWKFLLDHDVHGVIYHGDADMVCDFIGGLWAVESLQLPRKQSRQTWTVMIDGSEQVGGFFEDFGMMKYVTVKGAGHFAPQTNPAEAKKMLDLFVLNKE